MRNVTRLSGSHPGSLLAESCPDVPAFFGQKGLVQDPSVSLLGCARLAPAGVWVGSMALARHGYRYKVTNGYKLLPDPRWLCTHPSMHVRPARIDQAPVLEKRKNTLGTKP